MPDVLWRTTLVIRTDPCEAPMPQTVVPWAEALAFLQHLNQCA